MSFIVVISLLFTVKVSHELILSFPKVPYSENSKSFRKIIIGDYDIKQWTIVMSMRLLLFSVKFWDQLSKFIKTLEFVLLINILLFYYYLHNHFVTQ